MAGGARKDGDPLKMYTIVMSILVVGMAVLFFYVKSKRNVYAKANVRAETQMTGKGLRISIDDDKPRTLPDLALAVERLSNTYAQAAGGSDLGNRGISLSFMNIQSTRVHLRQIYASRERETPNTQDGYVTISQSFEYEGEAGGAPEIAQILGLLYNIESQGRYRVSEVSWTVVDPKENLTPPFDRVKKPRVAVALRLPTLD